MDINIVIHIILNENLSFLLACLFDSLVRPKIISETTHTKDTIKNKLITSPLIFIKINGKTNGLFQTKNLNVIYYSLKPAFLTAIL